MRKFASTWPAEHGIRQDDIEIRGRWKGGKNGRTVNKYINVEQLPTDGKVAACLCIGGPVKYKPKSGSGLTYEFLKTKACPGIFQHFAGDENNKIGCVLAMPLIWAAHTPGLEHLMSDEVRLRIKNAYDQIRGDHAADWNPICKVPLVVTTVENRLVIDEMLIMGQTQDGQAVRYEDLNEDDIGDGPGEDDEDDENDENVPPAHPPAPPQCQVPQFQANGHAYVQQNQQSLQAMHNTLHHIRQHLTEAEIRAVERDAALRNWAGERFRVQAENINRLRASAPFAAPPPANPPANPPPVGGGIPAGQAGNPNPDGPVPLRPATLSDAPSTIHDLWAEYQFGIGGRKPAKLFTGPERGRVKSQYSRRKKVWKIIVDLVNAGFDHDVACDKIYQACGYNKSVTQIIAAIYKEKGNRHPNLVV